MQTGYPIEIADTSCFILLNKIGELELLRRLFSRVTTTPAIAAEFGLPLPAWVELREANEPTPNLTVKLGEGESSAIALALEWPGALLVLDDLRSLFMALND